MAKWLGNVWPHAFRQPLWKPFGGHVGAEEDEEREGKGGGGEGGGGGGPNQADCEDVLSETWPKPYKTIAKPGRLRGRLRRNLTQTKPNQGQTRQIARTSQAKPGPNQAKPGPNQADCEDVLSETGPKPGQTRAQTRQIRRMSQAGRAAQPGQTRPNQAKPGPKPGKL